MPTPIPKINPDDPAQMSALLGSEATGGVGLAQKIKNYLGSTKGKVGAGSLLGWLALGSALNAANQGADRGVQREALQSQADISTPENLYYQAALPQAQAEESQARQALLSQISGGVLGPSLARGERLI